MNLEKELLDFLKLGQKLEYDISKVEPGFVGLHKHENLKESHIYLEGPEETQSYYEIPAVSLTGENEYYDPEFILLWLPNEQKYGTWDSDHWDLFIFDNCEWNDIKKSPDQYINYQWEPNDLKIMEFDPSLKYKLKQGMPY
ncbi:hypothetical protein [Flammeovirga sp. OC4]|uniref:hypothetical protein n=1 Tax=Flammeovirga sp. OC4 TaxID=1382345 RepID=UPI0005C54B30|nr:hypothetical protein [Flammeovirga sp. OC4]